MAAGAEDTRSPGRTDVSSLTEMVSLAMGDTGSGVAEDAAAAVGKEKTVSLW